MPIVGMAISIRMRMMAMTISSSIRVKAIGRMTERRARLRRESENLQFMGFLSLVEQAAQKQARPRKCYNVKTRKGNATLGRQGIGSSQ